jgi:ABC-type sulfate transport system permease component
MVTVLGLFGLQRETAVLIAFGSLIAAGLFVSVTAWILLRRDRRAERDRSRS